MDYALDHFTMHNTQLFVVQGPHSLFTYQNIGTNTATIQGSNDASTWSDIASLASGASLVKEHSYKYLRCLGDTQVSVNRGEGDNTIGGGSSGGTASYPSFTGNADKVLTVNATEDDVEWTTVSSSGGGSGGGINVIEYDPSQNEAVLGSIQNSDFIPTPASAADTRDSASWNASTGVMGVSVSTETIQSYPSMSTQQVGLRCPIDLYHYRGEFTIDASLCQDAWGFGLFGRNTSIIIESGGIEGLDLFSYLEQQHYKDVVSGYFDLKKPQTCAIFGDAAIGYEKRSWSSAPFNMVDYDSTPTGNYQVDKFQGLYKVKIGNIVDVHMDFGSMTYEQTLSYFQASFTEAELIVILSRKWAYCIELGALLELKNDTPYLYFFLTAYHIESSSAGAYTLDPTSQLTLSFDLQEIVNTVPVDAVDGDILHLSDNAKLLGKSLSKNTFVQLYDNKTKMIVHADQP